MKKDLVMQKCGNLGSDTTFNKAVEAFNVLQYPEKYWLPWKEAEELFRLLPPDMQDILLSLALGKHPCQKVDNSLECLKALGLIKATDKGMLRIVKPNFGNWIRLNHTRRGKIERLLIHRWNLGTTARSRLSSSTLLGSALFLLCIPIVVMLLPLLKMLDWLQSRLVASEIEGLVGLARNLALFVMIFLVVYYLSTRLGRQPNKGSLITTLSIPVVVALTVFWLGFPTHHALLFMILSVLDLLALHLLFRAYQALPTIKSNFENKKLRNLLEDTIKRDAWSDMKSWPALKLLLMVILSLTGFLFFQVVLAPREFRLSDPAELGEFLLIAPSWLSFRDEGTVLFSVRNDNEEPISGTMLIQPEGQNLIVIYPADKDRCLSNCSWGPLTSRGGLKQEVLEWRLQTPPRSDFPSEMLWKLRVDYCTRSLDTSSEPQCNHKIISANMIRIMFRTRGLLDEQPLVTVISMTFGVAYAIVQIMIGNLLINRSDD